MLRLVDGYLPLLGLLLLSVIFVRDGRLRWLALAFAVLTLTTIRTGGDAFQDLRFLTPALPFVYLCAGALLEQVSRWVERREYRGLLAALLIV
ncbi:MAG: hypothetical protein HC828_14710, partial [Blastochloris sp.]|nr:hypothetical protein [Blastochloris sp.]